MATSSKRLTSLDFFRGLTMMFMVLVNNPGSWNYVFGPLEHSEWNGCTPTDLVFPFFLYIVGVAMAFSFARRLQESTGRWFLYWKIIRRTLILILLGFFLGLYGRKFNFHIVRIPGVLQRIGLCYFFASMIVLHFKKKGQIIWSVGLLLGYWGLMVLVPFPGKGTNPWTLGSNFAQYVDNLLLKGHMWTPDFDPEGLISTIPAIVTTLLGYFTGVWLRSKKEPLEKTNRMFITANILLIFAIIWAHWMPINKQLWTSSYVLYTGGFAIDFLAISYWLIDVKGIRWFTPPFLVYGSNSILAYVGSQFIAATMFLWKVPLRDGTRISLQGYIFSNVFQPVFGNWYGSLMFAITYVLLWLGILTIFYKKRIFIKI